MGASGDRSGRRPWLRRRARAALATVTTLAAVAAMTACTAGEDPPDPSPSLPTRLTYAVFGPPAELEAHRQVVEAWNLEHPGIRVDLVTRPDAQAQAEALAEATDDGEVPDVFMLSRDDLAATLAAGITQPVGELLDEESRDVDLGDGYPIDAVRAFSDEAQLHCMPFGYSPLVVYYNTRLIDFARMESRGLDVPAADDGGWSFEEFEEAALFASRPATGSRGVHISPTLEELSPFVLSGGGRVYDDPAEPSSLALSDGDSVSALTTTLELL